MKGGSYFVEWGDYDGEYELCQDCGDVVEDPRAQRCPKCEGIRRGEEAERRYQETKLAHHRAYQARLRVRALIHNWWVSTA